jgi:hypothetical protein
MAIMVQRVDESSSIALGRTHYVPDAEQLGRNEITWRADGEVGWQTGILDRRTSKGTHDDEEKTR